MNSRANDPAYIEKQYFVRGMIPEHPQIFARWAERSKRAHTGGPS